MTGPRLMSRVISFYDAIDSIKGTVTVVNPFSDDFSIDDRLGAVFSEKDSGALKAIGELAQKQEFKHLTITIGVKTGDSLKESVSDMEDLQELLGQVKSETKTISGAYEFVQKHKIEPAIFVYKGSWFLFSLNGNIESYKRTELTDKYIKMDSCKPMDEFPDCMNCFSEKFCPEVETVVKQVYDS